jgi:hypothetical protein
MSWTICLPDWFFLFTDGEGAVVRRKVVDAVPEVGERRQSGFVQVFWKKLWLGENFWILKLF